VVLGTGLCASLSTFRYSSATFPPKEWPMSMSGVQACSVWWRSCAAVVSVCGAECFLRSTHLYNLISSMVHVSRSSVIRNERLSPSFRYNKLRVRCISFAVKLNKSCVGMR
jgi:hypothetical protein